MHPGVWTPRSAPIAALALKTLTSGAYPLFWRGKVFGKTSSWKQLSREQIPHWSGHRSPPLSFWKRTWNKTTCLEGGTSWQPGDESRARAAIIDSLEDRSVKEQYAMFFCLGNFGNFRIQLLVNVCIVLRLFKTNCGEGCWFFSVTLLTENAWDRLEAGYNVFPRVGPYLVQHAGCEAKGECFGRLVFMLENLMYHHGLKLCLQLPSNQCFFRFWKEVYNNQLW